MRTKLDLTVTVSLPWGLADIFRLENAFSNCHRPKIVAQGEEELLPPPGLFSQAKSMQWTLFASLERLHIPTGNTTIQCVCSSLWQTLRSHNIQVGSKLPEAQNVWQGWGLVEEMGKLARSSLWELTEGEIIPPSSNSSQGSPLSLYIYD